MYRFEREGKYGTHTDTENPYKWNERTIADILDIVLSMKRCYELRYFFKELFLSVEL